MSAMNVGFNKPDPSGQSESSSDVNDSGTVFVRGLASSVDDEKLLNRFSDVGPVRSAFVVRTGAGGASKGFGFVKYAIESDAQVAIETLTVGIVPSFCFILDTVLIFMTVIMILP